MNMLLRFGLENSLVAVVIAACALIAARLLRRPALAHGLWLLVLLKLITPPIVTVPIPKWFASGWKSQHAAAPVELASVTPVEAEIVEGASESAPVLAEQDANDALSAPAVVVAPAKWYENVAWSRITGTIWLMGSAFWLVLASWRIGRFARRTGGTEPAPLEVAERVSELSAQIGLHQPPRLIWTSGRVSPFVWSLGGRAWLTISADLWARLDGEQRDALLIHELAHLRRRDHWVRVIELIATGVHWWNPLLWFARRELRRAEEQCCDLWVMWALPKSARSYATALVETVEFLSPGPARLPFAASGMGRVHDLSRRITMIMNVATPRGLSRRGLVGLCGLALLLLPLGWTRGQDPEARPDQERAAKAALDAERQAMDALKKMQAALAAEATARQAVTHDGVAGAQSELELAKQRLQWAEEMRKKHYVSQAQVDADANRYKRALAEYEAAKQQRARQLDEANLQFQLLSAQREAKAAQVQKSKAMSQYASAALTRVTRLKDKGEFVSKDELAKAEAEVAIAEADVAKEVAELREVEIRVDHAKRSLDAFQAKLKEEEATAAARGRDFKALVQNRERSDRDSDRAGAEHSIVETNKRIAALEQKMDTILKELQAIKGQRTPERDREPGPDREAMHQHLRLAEELAKAGEGDGDWKQIVAKVYGEMLDREPNDSDWRNVEKLMKDERFAKSDRLMQIKLLIGSVIRSDEYRKAHPVRDSIPR